MKQKRVIKKDGLKELFETKKLCGSIAMTGANEYLVEKVCNLVKDSLDNNVSTHEIFEKTRNYLYQYNPGIAALYALERGLSALGPSGFVFEQYIAALFQDMNYKVSTNVYMKGEGVTHETDIVAEKGNVIFVIEAKYRNDFKTKTHINQVMYTDARLQDIRRAAIKNGDDREYYAWLITNTLFTDNAIHYAEQRDLQLVGWSFPKYINLMKIVYEKKLYPVTILPSITKSALKKMASMHILLVKHLVNFTINDLKEKFGLSMSLSKRLYREIHDLIKDYEV